MDMVGPASQKCTRSKFAAIRRIMRLMMTSDVAVVTITGAYPVSLFFVTVFETKRTIPTTERQLSSSRLSERIRLNDQWE
jgi:hypothetical protein